MPAIKPVSDLRSYTEVLRDVEPGSPVFLTKNGHGRYAILDIRDYDRIEAERRLASALSAGRASGEKDGWVSESDVRARFSGKAPADAN
jgi:prevent-host-death family protein